MTSLLQARLHPAREHLLRWLLRCPALLQRPRHRRHPDPARQPDRRLQRGDRTGRRV